MKVELVRVSRGRTLRGQLRRTRARSCVAAGVAALAALATAAVAHAAVIGNTAQGSSSGTPGADIVFGSVVTLPKTAVPTTFHFWASNSSPDDQAFVPAIYKVESGTPTTLAVQGSPVVVPAGAAAQAFDDSLPSTTLPRGDYLLALHAGPTSSSASIFFDAVAGAAVFTHAPFASGPPATWDTAGGGVADQSLSFWLDYDVDAHGPTISVPAPAPSVEATGPGGATVPYTVTATDAVDGAVAATCAPAAGSTFALGTTSVSCTAADSDGNTSTAAFDVVVHDTTPPALSGVPGDRTVRATASAGAAVTYPTPTANDLVDGPRAVACAPGSGSTFPVGRTVVTCSAADTRGNTASGSFAVTVDPPVSSSTKPAPAGHGGPAGGPPLDLGLGLTASTDAVAPGDGLTFRATISDGNGANASGVKLVLRLPAGLELVSSQASRGAGCSGGPVLACDLAWLSGDASTATVTVVTRVVGTGSLVTSASVTADEEDTNKADNAASLTVTSAEPAANLTPSTATRAPAIALSSGAKARAQAESRWITVVSASLSVAGAQQLRVAVAGPDGQKLPLLLRSRVGSAVTGYWRRTIVTHADGVGTSTLRLRVPSARLKRGLVYRVNVTAISAGGQTTPFSVTFKA